MCPICQGRHHLPGPRGWVRCVCMAAVVADSYIQPVLRQGETTCEYEGPVWPLRGLQVARGDLRAFRHRAWRSLVTYAHQGLTYDVVDAFQLVQIHFGQDETHASLAPLMRLGLLVVLWTPSPPNRYLIPLLHKVMETRLAASLPVWLYLGVEVWDTTEQSRILRAWCAQAPTQAALGPERRVNRLLVD